jgi:hypothetical protein
MGCAYCLPPLRREPGTSSFCASARSIASWSAEAYTSAGAPLAICASRASEAPKFEQHLRAGVAGLEQRADLAKGVGQAGHRGNRQVGRMNGETGQGEQRRAGAVPADSTGWSMSLHGRPEVG